jgi:predicted oxidoreductases (related to aryl-alcohol dehydrogenases)
MAISWILRRPEVTTVLVGASRVSQLDNSLAALKNTAFSEDELKRIDEILA